MESELEVAYTDQQSASTAQGQQGPFELVNMRQMEHKTRKLGKTTWLGMTLLELMTVLAIVGILAAMATPSLRESVIMSRARDMTGRVRAEILKTRNAARLQHTCIRLTLTNTATGIRSQRQTYGGCDAKTLMNNVIAGSYVSENSIESATELGTVTDTTTLDIKSGGGRMLIRLQVSPQVLLFGPSGGTFLQNPEDISIVKAGSMRPLGRYRVFPATGIVREL